MARHWDVMDHIYLPPPLTGLSLPDYTLTAPLELRIGPSTVPGAGLGLFLYTGPKWVSPGVILGKYWGPSTANGGLPALFLDPNRDFYPEARDDGDYLLQHGNYMLDASADCPMGYINKG